MLSADWSGRAVSNPGGPGIDVFSFQLVSVQSHWTGR